jgi:hypothetical protein
MSLEHRGQVAELPGKFDHATATYLFSLMDDHAAHDACEGENFEPLLMHLCDGTWKAVGFVAWIDYQQTDVGPYLEWILGIWVTPLGEAKPKLNYANATSLSFFGPLTQDEGFAFFAPKMILTATLPTEIGVEHYGIPKEVGRISYERSKAGARLAVESYWGQWIMRASVPTTRGSLAKLGVSVSLVRAFGLRAVVRFVQRREMPMTLMGSSRLVRKSALAVVKIDPGTQLLSWHDEDCELEINPENEWGKALQDLKFLPSLISHIPNLAFVLSGPVDQKGNRM